MKHLFVALVGLALGACAALAVLYYNPLSVEAAGALAGADRVFRYSLPGSVLELALGEDARWLGAAPGGDALWEETIDRSAVLGLVLEDASGTPSAIASRLLAPSIETDLLLRGVLVADHWLVTVPGEGTLFLRADSNAWPFLKEALVPAWLFDRPWQGPTEYWPTVGPGPDSSGIVVGVTGGFDGSEGQVVERYELTALDPRRAVAAATGELHVRLTGPQVAVQE